jgi:DNA-binding NarL/FixJ family response regulator
VHVTRPIFIIADDHTLVRDGLKLMVQQLHPGVTFLEAEDAETLAAHLRHGGPAGLALVDLNMPGMDRGDRLAELARIRPALPVVAISAMTSPDVVRRTLAIPSVCAFVPKSANVDHMRLAIDAALRGVKLVFAVEEQPASAAVQLSPRMEQVRGLLKQGLTNKRIAVQLHISEGTVKNYVTEIFRVLNVTNRTQAAQFDPDKS